MIFLNTIDRIAFTMRSFKNSPVVDLASLQVCIDVLFALLGGTYYVRSEKRNGKKIGALTHLFENCFSKIINRIVLGYGVVLFSRHFFKKSRLSKSVFLFLQGDNELFIFPNFFPLTSYFTAWKHRQVLRNTKGSLCEIPFITAKQNEIEELWYPLMPKAFRYQNLWETLKDPSRILEPISLGTKFEFMRKPIKIAKG